SHLTLVNGEAVREGVIVQGDTIALGTATFIVTRGTLPEEAPRAAAHVSEVTLSLFGGAGALDRDDLSAFLGEGRPQSVDGLLRLFALGRALSQAPDRAALHERCIGCIAES